MIRKHALLSTALLVCSSFFGAVAPVANLSAQGIEEKGAPGERIATNHVPSEIDSQAAAVSATTAPG